MQERRWKLRDVDACVECFRNASTYAQGVADCHAMLGWAPSGTAIRNAFSRAGYQSPASYVGEVRKTEPAPPPDACRMYVDRETEPQLAPIGELERILVIPDVHCPYEDKAAWRVMLNAARRFRPHTIVVLGDFLDGLSVSSHDRTPKQAAVQLEDEIKAGRALLDDLDALGATRRVFCEGNHDLRAQRLAARAMPGVYDSMATDKLLGLAERGWEFHGYRRHVKIGRISFVHDVGHSGKYAAQQNGAAFEASTVQGHTHRASACYFGNANGETHVSATLGWLGSKEAADYLAPIKTSRDWQLAFGIAYVEPCGNTHFQVVPIIEYRAVLNGELISLEAA